jgi:hypothetical protein
VSYPPGSAIEPDDDDDDVIAKGCCLLNESFRRREVAQVNLRAAARSATVSDRPISRTSS